MISFKNFISENKDALPDVKESIIGMAKRAVKGIASDRKTGQALQHMHDVHKDQKSGNDSFNQMNRDKARHFQMALRHHNNGDIEKRNQHINRGLKQDKGYPDPRDVGTSNSDQHRSHRNHLNSVVGMRESKIDPIQSPMVDPMDLRGRPPKRNPYPNSPYGMKHPLHPLNIKKNNRAAKGKK